MFNDKDTIELFSKEIYMPDSISFSAKPVDEDDKKLIEINVKTFKEETKYEFECTMQEFQDVIMFDIDGNHPSKEMIAHFVCKDSADICFIHFDNFMLINDILFKCKNIKPANEIKTFKEFCNIFGFDEKENPMIARDTKDTAHLRVTRENGMIIHFNEKFSSRYAYLAVVRDEDPVYINKEK